MASMDHNKVYTGLLSPNEVNPFYGMLLEVTGFKVIGFRVNECLLSQSMARGGNTMVTQKPLHLQDCERDWLGL
jgi:hypothetical protein